MINGTNIVEGVDINVSEIALSTLLTEMVEASKQAYGSHIKIAAKFNNLMPFAWYDIAPNEKSENNKTLKSFKSPLYVALKEAGHTNPSVPYGRMCDYGRNMRNGLAPNGKTTIDGEPVEQADESDGAGPTTRSIMLRYVEELTTLWKAADKIGNDLPAKVAAAQKDVESALKKLGLDVANIAK